MEQERKQLNEDLIVAWVRLTAVLKTSRITQGMNYNEAIVMMLCYNRYRERGDGVISFKEIADQTKMLKSLVNRTLDALINKGYLERVEGSDKRVTFVRIVEKNLEPFLKVHESSMRLADEITRIIGVDDVTAIIRISEKVCDANPLK